MEITSVTVRRIEKDTVYMEIIRNGEGMTVSTVITEDCLVAY